MVGVPNGKTVYVGVHKVVEEDGCTGIYRYGVLITTLPTWDEAIKLATEFELAYLQGMQDALDGVTY